MPEPAVKGSRWSFLRAASPCTTHLTRRALLGDLLLFGTGHGIDGGKSFLVSVLRILKIHTLCQMTGHNLEIRNLSKMRLDVSLVDEYGSRVSGVALNLVAILGDKLGLRRGDGGLDGELHEPLHTDVLLAERQKKGSTPP